MAAREVLLRIDLGPLVSLDLVRIEGGKAYLVVMAERGRISRRTHVTLHADQAARAGRFLLGADGVLAEALAKAAIDDLEAETRATTERMRDPVPEAVVEEITDVHPTPRAR